jgi:DNA mismatch endonuclease (patch repair protein)
MDIVDRKTRSRMMSNIRAKDTRPEMIARRYFWGQGLRYRLHAKDLPGRPDIVFPRYRTVVEVRGCFWHGHHGCRYFQLPRTSRTFWRMKIFATAQRDRSNVRELRRLGWRVLVVWECQLRNGRPARLRTVTRKITAENRPPK